MPTYLFLRYKLTHHELPQLNIDLSKLNEIGGNKVVRYDGDVVFTYLCFIFISNL